LLYDKLLSSDNSESQVNAFEIGLKGASGGEEEFQEKLKDKDYREKIEKAKQDSVEFQNKYNNFLKNNLGFFAYLNIPFYALVAFLVFLNKKIYNFAETVSIVLYQNAYTTLIGFLLNILFYFLGVNILISSAITFLIIYVYSNYSFQRLFKLTTRELIIANLKFFVITFVVFLLVIILGIALFILTQSVF
jgi:hypothetical protein